MIQYFQIYDFIITSETVLISDEKIYKLYFNIYRMIVRKTKFLPSTVCDIKTAISYYLHLMQIHICKVLSHFLEKERKKLRKTMVHMT